MLHAYYAFLETIGTSELMVIAFVALIVFGPRKLPELARKLGQSMGEFKRASDEFKRTWEHEVEMERLDIGGQRASQDATVSRAGLPAVSDVDAAAIASDTTLTGGVDETLMSSVGDPQMATMSETQSATTIARHTSRGTSDAFTATDSDTSSHETTETKAVTATTPPPGKEDWL